MSVNSSIASILDGIRRPKTQVMESGLLSAYRMVTIAQIAISLVIVGIVSLAADDRDRLAATANVGWMVLLTIYLSWPHLHLKLGRWFLPVALAINSFFPLLDREISIIKYLSLSEVISISQEEVVLLGWRLVVFLLFPAVIAAWQYGFKGIGIFIGLTTIIDFAFSGIFFEQTGVLLRYVAMLAFARGIFFSVIGLLVIQLLNSQKEQQVKLAEANDQLASYAATADQLATSRERNRLARELHDTLSHTLSSLSVQLEAADSVWEDAPDQSRNLLVKSIANARSGLAETRRALQDLRASPLEDLGLGLALRNLAESTAKRAGIELVLDVPKQIDALSEAQEQGLYRIAQEALENVVKHASAQQLKISMRHSSESEDSQWHLSILDNGMGFDLQQLSENGHYGLQGMQERAAMLGGTLDINSRVGDGTEVQVSL